MKYSPWLIWMGAVALWWVGVVAAAGPPADTWPQFRGPNSLGVAADAKPGPVDFGPGQHEVWKVAVPAGHSSPCVWHDRIFLSACDDAQKKLEVLCLSRRDGKVLWRDAVTVDELEPVHKTSSRATGTPACDGERVYTYFASYGLLAHTLDGAKVWEMPLPIPTLRFGSGTSPAVVGELVMLNRQQDLMFGRGAPKSATGKPAASELLAVERRTGKVAWHTDLPKPLGGVGYATPVACRGADGDLVVVAGGGRITAFEAKTGTAKWWSHQLPMVTTATPVIAGSVLYVNSTGLAGDVHRVEPPDYAKALEQWDKNKDGKLQRNEIPDDLAVFTRTREDHEGDFSLKQWFFQRADADRDGALSADEWKRAYGELADGFIGQMKPATLALDVGGSGDIAGQSKWRADRGVPEVPSLLVVGPRLYAVRNGGLVSCFDAANGKLHFEERLGASGAYYASPVSDGQHVYFASLSGVITILKAGDKFDRRARVDLGEEIAATPALVGGQLIVRTAKHLRAFAAGK